MHKDSIEKLKEKLTGYLTPKNLSYFLIAVYVLSLIPLLWIGHYNCPSADDYSEALQAHRAFLETGSVWKAFAAAVVRSWNDYFVWMGYYTCNMLMAFSPTVFGVRAYVVTTWILLGALSLSTYYLLSQIFTRVFKGDKYISRSIIMLMLFITVQCMVGRVEAFYWYSGAVNYILVHSILLLYYGLLISLIFDEGKKRKINIVLACIAGFVAAGGNQMSALNGAIILAVAVGFIYFRKKQKEYGYMLIPIAVYFIGFVINVAAPGNFVRGAEQTGFGPIKAVMVSLYYCLDYCMSEWTTWPVLIMVVMLIPLFAKLFKDTDFDFRYPGVVVLFGYGLVSAMMTPPLFALGNIGAARLQALTFAMYILVLTLCVGYLTGWVCKRYLYKRSSVTTEGRSSSEKSVPIFETWVALCLAFLVFGSILCIIPDEHYYSFTSAITDLRNGSAQRYHNTLAEREDVYLGSSGDVTVKDLPDEPKLLFFADISTDPEEWTNGAIARFYGLDSVKKE